MTDLSLPNLNILTQTTAPRSATAQLILSLPVIVQDLPQNLTEVPRQIQISGSVFTAENKEVFGLRTTAGSLLLSLPQLSPDVKEKILQQLLELSQTRQALDILIQAGSPPNQAVLKIPLPQQQQPTATPPAQTPSQTPAPELLKEPPIFLYKGAVLHAVVIENAAETSSFFPQQTGTKTPPEASAPPSTTTLPEEEAKSTPVSAFWKAVGKPEPAPTSSPSPVTFEKQTTTPVPKEVSIKENFQAPSNNQSAVTDKAPSSPPTTISSLSFSHQEIPAENTPSLPPRAQSPLQSSEAPRLENVTKTEIPTNTTRTTEIAPQPPTQVRTVGTTGVIEENLLPNAMQKSSLPTPQPSQQTSSSPSSQIENAPLRLNMAVDLILHEIIPKDQARPDIHKQTPDQIVAKVIANGPQGYSLLKTEETTFFVRQNLSLPVGTRLVLTPRPVQEDLPQPIKLYTDAPSPLTDLLQEVFQQAPQLAPQVLPFVPRPGKNMSSTVVFLFNALAQGSLSEWVGGDTLTLLRKINKDLADNLSRKFKENEGRVQDTDGDSWRSFSVPLYDNGHMQHFFLYLRNNERQNAQDGEQSPRKQDVRTRFLINLHPSSLGDMQLDGFSQKKRLDLIVRSERSLPGTLPQELKELYIKTLIALDYAGNISFQTGREHWLTMKPPEKTGSLIT